MELGIIVGIIFLAWLMWSSKSQKEMFLFYAWSGMILMIILEAAYHLLFK